MQGPMSHPEHIQEVNITNLLLDHSHLTFSQKAKLYREDYKTQEEHWYR